ncbi:hypothetical protein [Tenggerimyces flavus]|uniref:ABM domain-containing protein n=1 Tax=Tenggerimyces flavus TaxID=1708749 RepID=A0ABV7Y684_9ACTN|nr:hypothetical protein [Tenggerimyces flavus]MBM7785044.1 hypothetical protein [Tenggerimyces flavus]
MAVAVETRIHHATQVEHDALDERIGEAIGAMGCPPAGLMVHFTKPHGDGFVIVDVWRTEAELRSFHDDVLAAALAATGLDADPPVVSPIWGFARP